MKRMTALALSLLLMLTLPALAETPATPAFPTVETLAGFWASVGSQDATPYLRFLPDGTMVATFYDGETLQEGAYTLDAQAGTISLPDGSVWRVRFEACQDECYLSDSEADDPIPLGTTLLFFEKQPTDGIDDGWMCFAPATPSSPEEAEEEA